ncbi:hypothetical protein LPJ66_010383 [Kickxella alabastrina]|uniref:Uncharacterized protein n=1 Tax=Kickxella alabastrina TaxID=61397 RepID=A0ACC1I0U9_9FUNG|nr:hypothetical protein LPJ66_010383 [Kickxella alabastrina]
MNVNEELLCSFEILKPLTENLQTCMARVEANFWSRRQQVEAIMNEAIAAQAKKELEQQQMMIKQQELQEQIEIASEEAATAAAFASAAAAATAASAVTNQAPTKPLAAISHGGDDEEDNEVLGWTVHPSHTKSTMATAANAAESPMGGIERQRQSSEAAISSDAVINSKPAKAAHPRIVNKFELASTMTDDDDDEDDDDDGEDSSQNSALDGIGRTMGGIKEFDSESILHGTPPRGSKLKQHMVQGRSSTTSPPPSPPSPY